MTVDPDATIIVPVAIRTGEHVTNPRRKTKETPGDETHRAIIKIRTKPRKMFRKHKFSHETVSKLIFTL